MGIFARLKGLFVKPAAPKSKDYPTDIPYFTETVTFGNHMYRRAGDAPSVYFVDPVRGIRKKIVDSNGWICRFPGIEREDFWVRQVTANALLPQIRFRTSIEERGDRWIMRWQIQPDGRYWADDDGFGMEDDVEVILYTYIDGNGDFTGPFRIYSVGNRGYCLDRYVSYHRFAYEGTLLQLQQGKLSRYSTCSPFFPPIGGTGSAARCSSRNEDYYELRSLEEAAEYWADPVLSAHLRQLCETLLSYHEELYRVVGHGNDKRVWSCATLFYEVSGDPLFRALLGKFFSGKAHEYTLQKLNL